MKTVCLQCNSDTHRNPTLTPESAAVLSNKMTMKECVNEPCLSSPFLCHGPPVVALQFFSDFSETPLFSAGTTLRCLVLLFIFPQ